MTGYSARRCRCQPGWLWLRGAAQRLAREALLLLVFGLRSAIKSALLRQLSAVAGWRANWPARRNICKFFVPPGGDRPRR
jgi:hypothetical protein